MRLVFKYLLVLAAWLLMLVGGPAQAQSSQHTRLSKEELRQKGNVLLKSRDSLALGYFLRLREIAQDQSADSLLRAINDLIEAQLEFFNFPACLREINHGKSLLAQVQNRQISGRFYLLTGKTHKFLADYSEAERFFEKSILDFEAGADRSAMAEAQSELADNYRYKGDISESSDLQYEALKLYESLSDSQGIVDTRLDLAILEYYNRDFIEGSQMAEACAAWYRRKADSSQLGYALSVKGLMLAKANQNEAAKEAVEESIRIREAIGDLRGLGESYNNYSIVYYNLKDWSQARAYTERSLSFLRQGNDLRQISVILNNLSRLARKEGNMPLSYQYLEQALSEARRTRQKNSVMVSYDLFAENAALEKDFEKALEYREKYIAVRDSIYQEDKIKAIEELKVQYDSEKKEQENQALQSQLKLEHIFTLVVGLLLVLLLIIGTVVIRLQRIRRKQDQRVFDQEKTILETREALTQAELRNTRDQLEHNQEMLIGYMESILKKNELIQALEQKLNGDTAPSRPENQAVNQIIETHKLSPMDWENFQRLFTSANAGLLEKVQKQFPKLNEQETKLFMLLRLQLNLQQAANLLNSSPETLKKVRSELKKKLGLSEEQNLKSFIVDFG